MVNRWAGEILFSVNTLFCILSTSAYQCYIASVGEGSCQPVITELVHLNTLDEESYKVRMPVDWAAAESVKEKKVR